ncbi:LCP family protein [Oceanobacillus massiliensis]|uniref:LCP family glycopolymer transferase n=1 Tax=Oceanobacillus massiliensis TaxID=1465765 RepID=UPI000289F7BE|nr:LCP family protein [Oceanobacillus massiliensis]
MDNKSNKELFSYLEKEDLTFTKEDRIDTFKKIHRNSNKNKSNNNPIFFNIVKRYIGPILGTAVVLLLAIGLLLPNLYQGNENKQPITEQASKQETISFSVLLLGENSVSYRSTIHILLTYNSKDNSMKLVPIPRETYVEIFNSEGKSMGKDKIMHALALESSPELTVTAVSNLFDFPIDYYSVIPEEDIYAKLEMAKDDTGMNGIQTNEFGDLIKERLSFSEVKSLLTEGETNIPSDILNQLQTEKRNSESTQVIDMEKGIEETFINGIYYKQIDQRLLETTSDTLKQHLADK